MGSANYYLKARFTSEDRAKEQLPKVQEFFRQVGKAYDFWQKNRCTPDQVAFWRAMRRDYPQAYDFLDFQERAGGDHNNALSGCISFGDENAAENFEIDGDGIRYYEDTWHFADWDPLCDYLVARFGALKAGWVSDEYLNPFDSIHV